VLIDILMGAIIFVMGLSGYLRGAARQIVQLVALAVAVLLSPTVATWLSPTVQSWWPNLLPALADLIALAIAVVGLLVGTGLVGHGLVWALRPEQASPGLSRANRLLGLGLGVTKGVICMMVLLAGVAAIPVGQVEQLPDSLRLNFRQSATLYWVGRGNPINYTETIRLLAQLLDDVQHPSPPEPLRSPATQPFPAPSPEDVADLIR